MTLGLLRRQVRNSSYKLVVLVGHSRLSCPTFMTSKAKVISFITHARSYLMVAFLLFNSYDLYNNVLDFIKSTSRSQQSHVKIVIQRIQQISKTT
jgi:hypothetical protein